MDYQEAIEHTKEKGGLKIDFSGAMLRRKGGAQWREQVTSHYYQAREAWLNGDLGTVAEFFGLYI